ncbi:MAG: amidohydrolase family protein [Planctomycetes bacterium]|nr:amidohydrolase family protein [Planctomycetota bacterium]HPF13820.1 amidohydrolase family protein [Planctomycetota bacterium]HRV80303.1 amidohydrolase family protein [Planctomycetota bacterium]
MKSMRAHSWLFSLCLLSLGSYGSATLHAAVQDDEGPSAEEGDDQAADEDAEESDKERWQAIVGGDVYTGTGAVLKGATLLSHNGKISEIGYNLYIPEAAEVINAEGFRVYPGLVAIASTGLFGANADLADSVDPWSEEMLLGLASGITSAVQGDEIGKLNRGSIENVVVGKNFFQTLRYGSSSPSGKQELREKFEAAAKYLRKYKAWEQDRNKDKGPEPKKTGIDMGLVSILTGERQAYFNENQRSDLLEIARLAQRFGFRPVIGGGGEAWTVADELGRAGATVIVTPRNRNSKDERLVSEGGTTIENAALLYQKGVQVAIRSIGTGNSTMSGIAGRDILHLPIEAEFAIRGGLSPQAALEAITIVPARLAGVSHRIGSLEVGKDADCIITDGDILNYATFVQWAVVDGRMVYDKQAEMYYAHIRPRPEVALAPEAKVDPGEGPLEGEKGTDAESKEDGSNPPAPEEGSGDSDPEKKDE